MQLLEDRVLIKPDTTEEMSKGGIIIPEIAKEKTHRGLVIEIGQGRFFENGIQKEMTVKVGDRILYGKYAGNEIEVGEHKYLIVRESEVFMIL